MIAALLVATAFASGTASPKPPPPPAVDLAALPDTARIRPAQAGDKPHPLVAHLVVDKDVVAPGGTLRAGLVLVQDPGWHTYWRSPGDVGQPTLIEWKLPDGVEASGFDYPVPQRFELEGIVSYGYDDQVLLFSHVAIPEGTPAGPLTIAARAEWLVCEINCIRGDVELSLPITVGADAGPNAYSPLFDHYAAQLPTRLDRVGGVTVDVKVDPQPFVPEKPFTMTVTVKPGAGHTLSPPPAAGTWPAFTPILAPEVFVMSSALEPADGGFVATVTGETLAVDPVPAVSTLGGLLQLELDGKPVRTEVTADVPWAEPAPVAAADPAAAPAAPAAAVIAAAPASFGSSLLFAFLGGMLLNVMPCVLPVLTLKLYGLVQHGGHSPREQRAAGLVYGAGVLLSFVVLAAVVWVLRTVMGEDVGWGFQFQSPTYVAALGAIVFAFGLSLFGVFEVPVVGGSVAAEATVKEGHAGHFFAGVFATVLGTPCSAPFLAPAVGYAFSQPDFLTMLLFFLTIGAGLAAPFVIVAFVPALFAWFPQPGPWMDTFKKLMGFTLLATTVWLVDVLGGLLGADGAMGYLWFLGAVALGCFVFGHWGGVTETTGRQLAAAAAGAAITAAGAWWALDLEMPEAEAACASAEVKTEGLDFTDEVPWQPFTELAVEKTAGKPVFIDFTAKWCLTCKVTEKTVIESAAVRDAMAAHGVVPLKADWTRYDPVITRWLERHGRAGVPFWLVIPADRSQPEIALPDAMTQSMLVEALAKGAGKCSAPC